MQTNVAIVGGGLSGLYSAWLLQKAGVAFQLLEARDRFGGRILSVDGRGHLSPDGFDLGPSWFWPGMHPRMAGVVHELALRAFPQQAEGDIIVERSLVEAPRRFPAMRQEPQSMRLEGGTGAIVSALVKLLPEDQLHLGARVTHIAMRENDLVVSHDGSGASRHLLAKQVLLALPPRLLAATVDFKPALDGDTMAHWRRTATWMAPHAKVFALYEHAFWREAGLSGTAQSGVGPLVEIHDATSASDAAALFGFVGLDRKQRIAVGEETILKASIAQLARLFGPMAARPQATLFKDWTADPFTSTKADEQAEGHPVPEPGPWISGKWASYVSLAGSETSSSDPGYLAGALDSAECAVAEVLRRI